MLAAKTGKHIDMTLKLLIKFLFPRTCEEIGRDFHRLEMHKNLTRVRPEVGGQAVLMARSYRVKKVSN